VPYKHEDEYKTMIKEQIYKEYEKSKKKQEYNDFFKRKEN